MIALGIIPARFAAQRLPGKPVRRLCGKPLVQWVWEAAQQARELQRVVVATDSERIATICRRFGAEVVLTEGEFQNGSERVAAAYEQLRLHAEIVLNLQADEPFLQPAHIDSLIQALRAHPQWDVATLVQPVPNRSELFSPAVVKVVLRADSTALYFSRAPIPHLRDYPPQQWLRHGHFWKHIGIYAYRAPVLRQLRSLPPSHLEQAERLEQLRLLEAGFTIGCVPVSGMLLGIDTPEQLARARRWLRRHRLCG